MIAHDLIETARVLVPGGVGSPRQSVDLYEKRNRADYDPAERLAKSRVVLDLERVTEAISRFDRATNSDQRTLSVFLLFRER